MRVSVRLQPCKRPVKFSAIAPRPVDIFELPPPAGDFELYNVIARVPLRRYNSPSAHDVHTLRNEIRLPQPAP
jgi:hypothetical protein